MIRNTRLLWGKHANALNKNLKGDASKVAGRRPHHEARFADLGSTVLPGLPANFGKLIADETEKWGKVIRAAGIKAE